MSKNNAGVLSIIIVLLLLIPFTCMIKSCDEEISNQETVISQTEVGSEADTIYSSESLTPPESGDHELPSKYSSSAIAKAKDRVEKWILRGHLRLDLNAGKAYINNALWTLANVDQKTEIMATIMIFTEDKYGKEEKITRFYNYSTGKQIAEWKPIGGFDFDY